MSSSIQNFNGLDSNGSTPLRTVAGQRYALHVVGTFDSATIALQYVLNGATGVYENGSLSADGGLEFVASASDQLTVSSVGGSTNINAQVSLLKPSRPM